MSFIKRCSYRRMYDELYFEFSAEISELCEKYNYKMDDVNSSMKRILKIAEFREPTPNDVSMSATTYNIAKKHLERFFQIFRRLADHREKKIVSEISNSTSNDCFNHCHSNQSNLCIPRKSQDVEDGIPSYLDSVPGSDEQRSSKPTVQEQYEVERIISRTMSAEGTYIYHVKWLGYETSSDPENFVQEKDMVYLNKFIQMCPELIKEFELLERFKKKQRLKKLQERIYRARKRKRDAERREIALDDRSPNDSEDRANYVNTCRIVNLCSSTSSSNEETDKACEAIPYRTALNTVRDSRVQCNVRNDVRLTEVYLKRKKRKEKKVLSNKRILSSSESEESDNNSSGKISRKEVLRRDGSSFISTDSKEKIKHIKQRDCENNTSDSHLCSMDGNPQNTVYLEKKCMGSECDIDEDDPYGGFKYVSRKSDGFQRGYKAVKVSLVTEHPITGHVVGVVVFTRPCSGNEFAQYIPLREIHQNAPAELRHYFQTANSKDQKELALSLLLQKNKM